MKISTAEIKLILKKSVAGDKVYTVADLCECVRAKSKKEFTRGQIHGAISQLANSGDIVRVERGLYSGKDQSNGKEGTKVSIDFQISIQKDILESKSMPKILITGFDPFGGEMINPAYEAVKLLPEQIAGAEIVKMEVPTVFKKDGFILEAAIEQHHPDMVICVGQAGGRAVITIEKVAINLMEARIPDNEGQQPTDEPVCADGPTAYFTNLPVKAMISHMRKHGIPAQISYTAGTFVCNDIMYRLMHLIEQKYPKMKGGFIHVPFLPQQVTERSEAAASMSAEMIARGIGCAIEAAVLH